MCLYSAICCSTQHSQNAFSSELLHLDLCAPRTHKNTREKTSALLERISYGVFARRLTRSGTQHQRPIPASAVREADLMGPAVFVWDSVNHRRQESGTYVHYHHLQVMGFWRFITAGRIARWYPCWKFPLIYCLVTVRVSAKLSLQQLPLPVSVEIGVSLPINLSEITGCCGNR